MRKEYIGYKRNHEWTRTDEEYIQTQYTIYKLFRRNDASKI